MQTQTKRFSRVAFPFLVIALNSTPGGWKDTSALGIAKAKQCTKRKEGRRGMKNSKNERKKKSMFAIKIKKGTTKQEAAFEK